MGAWFKERVGLQFPSSYHTMKRIALSFICLIVTGLAYSQKWVAPTYAIQTTPDVLYGTAPDFAGNLRMLRMNITVPTNDVPPPCGRPMLIAVHGGAFLAGDKSEATLQSLMKDFAQRGYATASVNYRLGMLQTNQERHCNITQIFNTPWDCYNIADTAEWYRGAYRAMQDVRGAIRYLVNNRTTYQIDPQNVFLVGESAGGFTVLNVAFLDSPLEKPATAYALPDALPPNNIYESACIQQFQWDTSILSMSLKRPDLGPMEGILNSPSPPYTIRGVGNFYGGAMGDLFSENTYAAEPPALYIFHQPNDLIVPFNMGRVLEGYSDCCIGLGCATIISRPIVYGSAGIKVQLDNLKNIGKKVPEYIFDQTSNTANCALQVINPALTGHAIDNYTLRTSNMAKFFATRVAACVSSTRNPEWALSDLIISTNPVRDVLTVEWSGGVASVLSAVLVDTGGKVVFRKDDMDSEVRQFQMTFGADRPSGVYLLLLTTQQGVMSRVVVR